MTNSQSPPGTQTQDSSAELLRIEKRKSALDQMVAIASSLESLREALQATTMLGTKAASLPVEVLHLFEQLKVQIENLDNKAIQQRLQALDNKLLLELDSMLALTEGCDEALLTAKQKMRDFQRLAQTAVALRVILDRRGYLAPALPELAQHKNLQQSVKNLQARESAQRWQVMHEIASFAAEILLIQQRSTGPMATMLQQVEADLKLCHRHLLEGKAINDLPIDIGNIELTALTDEQDIDLAAAPLPTGGVAAESVTTDDSEQEPATSADKTESLVEAPSHKQSLWHKFKHWLDTPWSTRWKDIDKRQKK